MATPLLVAFRLLTRREMADVENSNVFRDKSASKIPRNHSEINFLKPPIRISSGSDKEEWPPGPVFDAAMKYSNIESVIMNPLCCGYLLQFCEAQHNSENVRFFLEVDEFMDLFAADKDRDIWKHGFEEIDNLAKFLEVDEIRNHGDSSGTRHKKRDAIWPSLTEKSAALDKIEVILNKYLNNDSSSQVCISDPLIDRTMKRIGLLHLYGPKVFEEATREPIKTMKKDILPRFLVSDTFQKMIVNVSSCEPTPPPASELKVPPPRSWLLTASTLEDLPESRRFQLEEIRNCLHLYNEFLSFLRNRVSSENLICVRMIDIFQDLIKTVDTKSAEIQAWKIYQYFVAPGSAYEVSIHHIHRKHVMLGMAEPKKGMFNNIRHSAHETLKVNFETFKQTNQYKLMGKMMRDRKLDIMKLQSGDSAPTTYSGCFGMRK